MGIRKGPGNGVLELVGVVWVKNFLVLQTGIWDCLILENLAFGEKIL